MVMSSKNILVVKLRINIDWTVENLGWLNIR